MTPTIWLDLAAVAQRDADQLRDQYAWPPKKLTADERREIDRLECIARACAYRSRSEG